MSESDWKRGRAQWKRAQRSREAAYAALVAKYDLRSDRDPSQPFSDFLCDIPLGWLELVEELVSALTALGWDRLVGDVRQKWGSLRVYVGHRTDAMQRLIDETEQRSLTICEECGNPGTLRPRRS